MDGDVQEQNGGKETQEPPNKETREPTAEEVAMAKVLAFYYWGNCGVL